MTGSLDGVKVVVTRPAHQAGELADRLRAAGALPIVLPVIAIENAADGGQALRAAFGSLDNYDWLVVTSVNTVDRIAPLLADFDFVRRDTPLPGDLAHEVGRKPNVAAIGAGTADALASIGLTVDLLPDEFVAESLLDAFPAGTGRVLLPRAAVARDVLPEGLQRLGWTVEVVEAYRTVDLVPEAGDLESALAADVLTFTAPSTVRAFLAAAGDRRLPPSIICIGPVTAAAALAAGLDVAAVAPEHTIEGLVETLISSK